MAKLIIYFKNFTNAPNKVLLGLHNTHMMHRRHLNTAKVPFTIVSFPVTLAMRQITKQYDCCTKHNYGAGEGVLKAEIIIYIMKREDQQDATIRCSLLTSVSTCFGHHYAHLQENKDLVTAFGVLFWFCWMWLVAVVGRCLVGC